MLRPVTGAIVLTATLLAGISIAQTQTNDLPRQPLLTFDESKDKSNNRLLVRLSEPITEAALAELDQYGTVHGWLDRYRLVAVTPTGRNGRAAIESLSLVASVEEDRVRHLVDVGTWDRDILDVHDMRPTAGAPFGPDDREVAQTGAGVHVAVIDTGLIKRWREVLDESKVRTDLARAFMGGGAVAEDFVPVNEFNTSNPTNLWERDTNSHGTAVGSHVIGFIFPGIGVIAGTAPDARIIPLKVFPNGQAFTWSSRIIAAIAYVTALRQEGVIGPTVINMSLGGSAPGTLERIAIQDAIAAGVIVVASAGNSGEAGMGWPGAFPEVISVGASSWVQEFAPPFLNSFWVASDVDNDPDSSGTPEPDQSGVASFSSRARPDLNDPFPGVPDQQLDVMAPGQLTVAPCLLPGVGDGNLTFCFWFGTSFSSPLTAGVAALLLEQNFALTQAQVESVLKSTAGAMPDTGGYNSALLGPIVWDTDCEGVPCDPVGSGLVQADAALNGSQATRNAKKKR